MLPNVSIGDVVRSLPQPALAIDAEGRILALNLQAEGLLGHAATGRHFITVLRQPTLVEAVEGSLSDHKMRSAPYLSGGVGRETTFDVEICPVAGSRTTLLLFQDRTGKAEAGEMRRDFVANVSHELRTPLTAMIGFIETLQGPAREDGAARDRFLAIMADEAGRMNRLVGDLLALSRVEADERVRPTQEVELRAILQTTLRNLTPLAQSQNVTLANALEEDPITLRGDADQLQQVFTNLIENSIKYGGPNKTVHLDIARSEHDAALRQPSVRVVVRDEGPGIEAHHLPRLTERFYRADTHRSRALGGTGLGLAIVKHILNRHRGRLLMESVPGQGASFTVVLPTDRSELASG